MTEGQKDILKQDKVDQEQANEEFEQQKTKGVRDMLGEPKKAVIKLAIPMVIAMMLQSVYNLADAFWVSLLGADELASVGFCFPFFFMMIALGTGIGIGAASAIARRIGAKDKIGADNAADHGLVISVIMAALVTIPLYVAAPYMFSAMGAGPTVGPLAVEYGRVIFLGAIFMFFMNLATAILRGEGDMKRAMYAMVISSILNIILDPIFILPQFLDMGVTGAAVATVLSIIVACIPLFYWLIIKKDSYVSINIRNFRFKKDILKDILRVGIPASVSQLSMSIMMIMTELIIVSVGSTDGIAIFTTGFRIMSIATMPAMGLSVAMISVAGAAYGAKQYHKVDIVHKFSVKLGVLWELAMAVTMFILAPYTAMAFTMSEGSAMLYNGLLMILYIMCFEYVVVPMGMMSSSLFQAVGEGTKALIVTILRAIVFATAGAYIFGVLIFGSLEGIWWGLVIGNAIGSLIALIWARVYLRKLVRENPQGAST